MGKHERKFPRLGAPVRPLKAACALSHIYTHIMRHAGAGPLPSCEPTTLWEGAAGLRFVVCTFGAHGGKLPIDPVSRACKGHPGPPPSRPPIEAAHFPPRPCTSHAAQGRPASYALCLCASCCPWLRCPRTTRARGFRRDCGRARRRLCGERRSAARERRSRASSWKTCVRCG